MYEDGVYMLLAESITSHPCMISFFYIVFPRCTWLWNLVLSRNKQKSCLLLFLSPSRKRPTVLLSARSPTIALKFSRMTMVFLPILWSVLICSIVFSYICNLFFITSRLMEEKLEQVPTISASSWWHIQSTVPRKCLPFYSAVDVPILHVGWIPLFCDWLFLRDLQHICFH